MNAPIRRFLVGFLLSVMAVGLCRADSPPERPSRYTIYSRNRAFQAVLDPKSDTTTVYKLGKEQRKVRLWSMPGWYRVAYLANDGRHLVIGFDGMNLLPLNYRKEWKMVSFYDRGQLIRSYSLAQVILDCQNLRATASHFAWGTYWGINKRGEFVIDTEENRRLVYDVATGRRIKTMPPVEDSLLYPEPPTAEEEAAIRLMERKWEWEQHRRHWAVAAVAFSPDGHHALSAHFDNKVYLWDLTTGMELRRFEEFGPSTSRIVFSPDGKYVLYGKPCRLWDSTSGAEIHHFNGRSEDVRCAVYAPDGKFILKGMLDGTIRLWDVATGEERRRFEGPTGPISFVAMSRDGAYVVGGSREGLVHLWGASNGKEIRRFDAGNKYMAATVSPDGKYVLLGKYNDRNVYVADLWDTATGELLRSFIGHTYYIYTAAFTADGKYVLTGSGDDTARLWDVATGEEVRRFNANISRNSATNSAAISPDGQRVLTGGNDGVIRLWNATTGRIIRRF